MPALIKPARQNQVFCTAVDRNGGWQSQLRLSSTISSKPNGLAGIQLDGNAAAGDFLLSLSPANLTAARRWSFPDRSDTVAGLGAQTFTGAQTISAGAAVSLSLSGPASTAGSSPDLRLMFTSDADAVFSYLAYSHDNIAQAFDSYYNGASWIASNTSAAQVYKTSSSLRIYANATLTKGNSFTPTERFRLDCATGDTSIFSSTASTSTTTGALVVTGGIGCGGRVTVDGATTKTLKYVNGTANAAVAVTFGAVGPTGSTAGNQQGWLRVDIAGTDRYIPYW